MKTQLAGLLFLATLCYHVTYGASANETLATVEENDNRDFELDNNTLIRE